LSKSRAKITKITEKNKVFKRILFWYILCLRLANAI